VISIVIAGHYSGSPMIASFMNTPVLIIILTIILSLMMVSRIPLLSLKVKNLKFKGNEGRYILIALILINYLIFGIVVMPLIIPLYIVASALSLLF
jgi:CDP-diacylglycerol--serine O-phosphatidyltransferase